MKPNLTTLLQEFFDKEGVQKELQESENVSFFKLEIPEGQIILEVNPGRMMEFRMLVTGTTMVNSLNFQDLLSVFPIIEDDQDELFHCDTDVNAWGITFGTSFHGLPIEYQDMLDHFEIPWDTIYQDTAIEIQDSFTDNEDPDESYNNAQLSLYLTITITDYAS